MDSGKHNTIIKKMTDMWGKKAFILKILKYFRALVLSLETFILKLFLFR